MLCSCIDVALELDSCLFAWPQQGDVHGDDVPIVAAESILQQLRNLRGDFLVPATPVGSTARTVRPSGGIPRALRQ